NAGDGDALTVSSRAAQTGVIPSRVDGEGSRCTGSLAPLGMTQGPTDVCMPVRTARIVLQPLLIALTLAFAARAAVRIYAIPSASMAPTLQVGDRIIVTPYHSGAPARGDIVVF